LSRVLAIPQAGYELVDDVTKDLHYLVLADAGSTTAKAVKARKLDVRVITEQQLADRLTQPS